jgi:nucleotide-binding universal stress UspA family protein
LVVLLDRLAPGQGAFSHALEWAWHLRLPIHAWALRIPDSFVPKINECAKVCADWGVKLGLTPVEDDPSPWLQQHLEPDDLLTITHAPAGTERFALIRQALQSTAAVLICPEEWKSTLSRMLVLYESWEVNQDALETSMELCRWVRAVPIVLTVASTQREGLRRQQSARAVFAERDQDGHFDLLIGAEVAEAAAHVARWRRCRLLVMGRSGRRPWTRWFGESTTDRLLGLADSLAVLTIPKRFVSAKPGEPLLEWR